MNASATGGLGAALRDRFEERARLIDRAQALESHPQASGEETDGRRRGAEALLRQALRALGERDCFDLGRRVLAGDAVAAGGVETWAALQELALAGLVTWDLSTGTVEATPLLRELDAVLASALAEAARE